MSYIISAILLFLLYNFIVKFVIPVYRTTRQVRRQFSAMKEQFQQQQQPPTQPDPGFRANEKKEPKKSGEYIDFEELK